MTDEQVVEIALSENESAYEAFERVLARLAAAEKALRDALLLLGQASGSESMDRAKAILDAALHPDGAA